MKALVGAFNQEKALVEAFFVIVKTSFAAVLCYGGIYFGTFVLLFLAVKDYLSRKGKNVCE